MANLSISDSLHMDKLTTHTNDDLMMVYLYKLYVALSMKGKNYMLNKC